MTATPVKPEDLADYLDEDIYEISNGDFVFEAMCEKIVDLNPQASMENIAQRFEEQDDLDPKEFATREFEKYVHDDTYEIISYAQRNQWIKYTVEGLIEFGVADPSWRDEF